MRKPSFYLFALMFVAFELSLVDLSKTTKNEKVVAPQTLAKSCKQNAFVGPIAISDIDKTGFNEISFLVNDDIAIENKQVTSHSHNAFVGPIAKKSEPNLKLNETIELPPMQEQIVDIPVEDIRPIAINDIDETGFNEVSFLVNNDIAKENKKVISRSRNQKAELAYWKTVHSIESKQGKLLFRPSNKQRNCTYTLSPCGHHQLTVQALKDIGCNSLQCRKDRLNYDKSLAMSKLLLSKNESRLKKSGYSNLDDYQKYLIHQQGATGIKTIIAATRGKKLLSVSMKKNMAGNSPYSYKQLRRMGSKLAAKTFLKHWEKKWKKEQQILASNTVNEVSSISLSEQLDSYIDNHYDG